MLYQELPPAAGLASAVASFWRFSLDPSSATGPVDHTVPPDGLVNLCWTPRNGPVLVGPRMTALRVPVWPGHDYVGVRFLPGAAERILGVSPVSLRGITAPYRRPWVPESISLPNLAGFLHDAARRSGWTGPDTVVADLTGRILDSDGTAPVASLVAHFNLSYRQLLRRFYQASGLTIKEFSRLRRQRAACLEALRVADPAWADVSAGTGYADQSHLIREFRDIYGWPPRLVLEYLQRIDHRF